MNNLIKRYIPQKVDLYLRSKKHIYVKWNKDLTSEIYTLDYDGLVIICDTILRIAGTRDLDNKNYVEVSKESFFKILNNDYTLYLDYLIEENIVQSDNQYIVGEKTKSYRINPEYISSEKLESILISKTIFNKRTLKAIKVDSKLKIPIKHKNNYFKTFKIDYDSAIEYLYYCYFNDIEDHKGRVLTKYTKDILQHKLLQIRDGQLWLSRSSSNGRINSNLTTLNGDYKQFILGYDYSLDIVSSQPGLLSLLIQIIKVLKGESDKNQLSSLSSSSYVYKMLSGIVGKEVSIRVSKELKKVKLPLQKEVEKWAILCENGSLYEYFKDVILEKMNLNIPRHKAKEIVITTLYSPSRLDNEYKKLFNAVFPSTYQFLSQIKNIINIKRSHRILPIMLQSLESYIWVENILPELDRMDIRHLFIHDSIVVRKEDLDRAELKIMEVYFKFGINAKVKIEKLKDK